MRRSARRVGWVGLGLSLPVSAMAWAQRGELRVWDTNRWAFRSARGMGQVVESPAADLTQLVAQGQFPGLSPTETYELLARQPLAQTTAADWERLAHAALEAGRHEQALLHAQSAIAAYRPTRPGHSRVGRVVAGRQAAAGNPPSFAGAGLPGSRPGTGRPTRGLGAKPGTRPLGPSPGARASCPSPRGAGLLPATKRPRWPRSDRTVGPFPQCPRTDMFVVP